MSYVKHGLWASAATAALMALFMACASNEDSPAPTYPQGGSAGTAGAAGQAGGGAGQAGAAGTAGEAGSGNGGSAGSGGSGNGGSAGTGGSGTAGDHVLISEVCMLPDDAEFIELWNPTGQEIDLTDYYLSDNSVYYTITSGVWNPSQSAGGVVVIGANPNAYETHYGSCPTFFLNTNSAAVACGGNPVPAMLVPPNGTLGDQFGSLVSNNREMIVLFTWDGSSATVKDVDYVTWGDTFEDATRVDKSGASGYQADTARGSQKGATTGFVPDGGTPDGGGDLAIQRCSIESSEKLTGGNGLTGHDETSEDFGVSFPATASPTPGVKNSCLP